MRAVDVPVTVTKKRYYCEKCEREFTNKAKCARHEKICGCDHQFQLTSVFRGEFCVYCSVCKCHIRGKLVPEATDVLSQFIKDHPKEFQLESATV